MLKPMGTRILVKRMEQPKLKSETIIIPDSVDAEGSPYALVLAVGPGCTGHVKVADTVILSKYTGAPVSVTLDGETMEALIVPEEDVLAVLED